jgi:hypothetical protein
MFFLSLIEREYDCIQKYVFAAWQLGRFGPGTSPLLDRALCEFIRSLSVSIKINKIQTDIFSSNSTAWACGLPLVLTEGTYVPYHDTAPGDTAVRWHSQWGKVLTDRKQFRRSLACKCIDSTSPFTSQIINLEVALL